MNETFEGEFKLVFHLAPPIMERKNPSTGEPMKRSFGPWMLNAFKLLARFKGLRGTPLDLFGYSAERRRERALIGEYEETVEMLLKRLSPRNHALAVEIACIPEHIRGFGHVKLRHLEDAKRKEAELLAAYRTPVDLRVIKVAA